MAMKTTLGPPKILSVDDTPANLFAMRALLEPLGCAIRDALSGEEAIALARSEHFAAVLLDVMMPGMDGLETLARLQATALLPETPVILITAADPDSETLRQAYNLGAVDYILKPVAPEVLRGKVRAFVSLYEANAALRRRDAALAAKDRQIAILAHDLRNPLSAVMAGTHSLLSADLPMGSRSTAERVARAAVRMNEMVRDLLDHARLVGGALAIVRQPMDLHRLCRELIDEFEMANPTIHVALEVVGDVRGDWDPARVHQAVLNLVGNASRYGEGRVQIRVVDRGQCVEIVVHNEGAPISPTLLPVLFEPFERGTDENAGLGLGLYIVRTIIGAHGGDVSVESSRDRGTTFTVRLPRLAHFEDQPISA